MWGIDHLERRRDVTWLRPIAFGVGILVLSAALGETAAAGVVTVSSVLEATKSAIAEQTGVQVVFDATSGLSSTSEKIVADVGTTSGAETVSIGKAHLAARLTPTEGYISGNSSGLTTIFGLSSPEAKKVGPDWVSWKAGTSQYSNLKSDLTISSITALLPRVKGTKLSTKASGGVKLYVLKWTTAATGTTPKLAITLTISATGTILPVEAVSTAADGTKATTKLSHWGGQPLVSAPPIASTIASSKVTG
jgi:hypothetical protein